MKYWINTGNKTYGPFDATQLKKLALKGELKRDHKISTDQKRWTIAEAVKGIVFKSTEARAKPATEAVCDDGGVRATTTDRQNASQPIGSNQTPPDRSRRAGVDRAALSDGEIAQSLLQGTPKAEVQPASRVSEIANTANRSDKADAELLQLLFSDRRQLLRRRLAAWVIDAFVLAVVTVLVLFCMLVMFGLLFSMADASMTFGRTESFIVNVVLLAIVLPILLQRDAGRVVGKRLLGIMTVDSSGRPCTPWRSAARNVLLMLPVMPVIEGVIALKRNDNRRLGDILAGTFVVRDYWPFLNETILHERQETVEKVACWILQTEMCIPDKNSKQRNPNLLRMFRHIIRRQKLVCDRLANLDTVFHGKAAVLADLQSVAEQQLNTLRKMSRSGWSQKGLRVEHMDEFRSLQQHKLELVAKL